MLKTELFQLPPNTAETDETPAPPEAVHYFSERGAEVGPQGPETPDEEADSTHKDPNAEERAGALSAAKSEVHDVLNDRELEKIISGIDFADSNVAFNISNSYHAEAETGEQNTVIRGTGSSRGGIVSPPQYRDDGNKDKWGNPSDEAHYGGQPVEKVGIREGSNIVWAKEKQTVPRRGVLGKMGLKTTREVDVVKETIPTYTFDYAFAAPSHSDDEDARKVGNNTGQRINLSVNITKEQAQQLSAILAKKPEAARLVLDAFMAKTGDAGKWNAELFDEEGAFYDPGARYGDELVARDVRPNYGTKPDLKPEVVGLLTTENEPTLAAA